MTREDQAFIEERAEALAVVALTRRDDIHLCRGPKWSGYDISAELLAEGRPTGTQFAVAIIPTESELTKSHIRRLVRKVLPDIDEKEQLALPHMMLFADVVRDDVRYLWQMTADSDARALDRQGLDEVVSSVRKWYSEQSSRQVA